MESLPSNGETLIPISKEEEKPLPKGNSYAAKKSVAQRMMDIALLTSNANQLRYVLQFGTASPTFAVAVTLIALSLALQIAVGIYLIFRVKSSSTVQEKEQAHSIVVGGVFLITIVNVLVTAFSLEPIVATANNNGTSVLFSNRNNNITELGENP